MARWLEGDLAYQPGYHGGPDSETAPLVPTLAALNRVGFVTENSQPGALWPGGGQRAWVSGFCDDSLVERIQQAVLPTELIVLAMPPFGEWQGMRVPISMGDGEAGTWAGSVLDLENLVHYYGADVHPDGVTSLAMAWQVCVFDPKWGRTDLLWSTLEQALLG